MTNEALFAQRSHLDVDREGAVMINANEFPLGPCKEALEALNEAASDGRYRFGESRRLAAAAASSEGLSNEQCLAFGGSSDPLHRTVFAFCSKGLPLVTASPGYEAAEEVASFLEVPIHRVPLRTSDYSHDVAAMLKAAAGRPAVFYVCSPNNPTGTLTPLADIEGLVREMAAGSVALIDEAYIHFAGAPTALPLIGGGKDVILLRTFSKIYGMAGLRAGLAFARPDLLERLRRYGPGFVPSTGMAAATASLAVKGLVEQRREYVAKTRESLFKWLKERNVAFVPSVSNKFMFDAGRPAQEAIARLAAGRVYVGRPWAAWPKHVRVTIGKPEEMEKFKTALIQMKAG